jgi:hypothetical protein
MQQLSSQKENPRGAVCGAHAVQLELKERHTGDGQDGQRQQHLDQCKSSALPDTETWRTKGTADKRR